MSRSPATIAYLFTTFPKSTETFLQREIIAMQQHGVNLRLYSFWGGGGQFRGLPVDSFNKWRLLELIWVIPWVAITEWPVFKIILHGLFTRKAPSWLNFWENMLGAGFAGLFYKKFRRDPPTWIHAAWGGGPATAAWMMKGFNGHPYSAAAHAYDIYEHGGDWWLNEKLAEAAFIHTSTEMGRASLIARGIDREKIHVIRRGLDTFPRLKNLRFPRKPLRIVCIARLVEKKGLDVQLAVYAALRESGLPFEAHIVGEGPLRAQLNALANELRLGDTVQFTGHLPQPAVWSQLEWADVLVHTGRIASSGDRDGLPNVIPEAMSAGVLVVSSPAAATTEAIQDGITGLIAPLESTQTWIDAFTRLATDDVLAEQIRLNARIWAEENYDAHQNARRIDNLFKRAIAAQEGTR